MATVERPTTGRRPYAEYFDEQGFPWFENGEHMDQRTFHERYLKTPPGYHAELIGGIVYVMFPLRMGHGRSDSRFIGTFFAYCAATPGVQVQNNTTTILDDLSEPQPDSALLILSDYGGQTLDGDDDFTHGAPELIVEVAPSSRSIDLHAKFRDYERAGVREYVVYDASSQVIQWFLREDGRLVPLAMDADGLFRSRTFPGLWLDAASFARDDKPALLAALHQGLASPEHAAFVAELQRRKAEHDASQG
jgi:Uma2 family endonuclease